MFHGSIPADMRKIVGEIVGEWDCPNVFVGCSGNFTVERVLCGVTGHHLHSNDITLYSSAIGWYFSGQPVEICLQPEYEAEVGWLQGFMGSDVDTLATVLLSTRLAPCIGRGDHVYYGRLLRGFERQWPELHKKTVARLMASPLVLADFFCGDVYELAEKADKSQGFVSYPPFFGEARDYEKGFAVIQQMFGFRLPQYEVMGGERMKRFFELMMSFRYWLFGTKERLPQFGRYLRGVTQTTNRGVPIYVYGNVGPMRIVRPAQVVEPVTVPRLRPDERVGEVMALAPLTEGQFGALRSVYMNEHIKPGQATLPVGVLVDGVLVGVFAFSAAPNLANWDTHIEGPTIYLLSDFPVAPSGHERLAKLVLYAALSQEGKLLAERVCRHRIRSCVTTAFSRRPVSMKYRGLFKLLMRTEGDGEGYYGQNKLNYGAMMGEWDLAKGLELWKKKHGKFVEVNDG